MITCPLCQAPVSLSKPTEGHYDKRATLLYVPDGSTDDFECPNGHFTRYRSGFHKPAYGLFVPAYNYAITILPWKFTWESISHQCRVYEVADHFINIKEQHTMTSLEEVIHLAERLKNLRAFL
jgi:hypothetical protein